ncbi:hypothetical protein J7M22_00170 [Candidatus Poribacteria bacterium]|nr:hypothetical protein [Candidatus Poribacteria bacterium]
MMTIGFAGFLFMTLTALPFADPERAAETAHNRPPGGRCQARLYRPPARRSDLHLRR